jgi:hypothetical protein
MDDASNKDTQPIETTTFLEWPAQFTPGVAEVVTASWDYGFGKRQHTHLLLPQSETEGMLRASEKTVTLDRPGNPLRRYDTNFIAGNKRTEDAHAVDILSSDDFPYSATEQEAGNGKSFWERWRDVKLKISGEGSQLQSELGNGSKDSVFDGHNDTHVLSELLSKTLHATLARNLGIQRQHQDSGMDDATRIKAVKSLISDT